MEFDRRTTLARLGQAGATIALLPDPLLAQIRRTPAAVLGPFYPVAKPVEQDSDLSLLKGHPRALGQLIEVSGRILDAHGNPVGNARVEIWQANAAGRYNHPADRNPARVDPNFQGYGVLRTDRLGRYRFKSIKPGPYPDENGAARPPHIHFDISGNRSRLVTQMLFPGEPLNETDDVIEPRKRPGLTSMDFGPSSEGMRRFGWNIILPAD
jgi:protocatechuate 3,4-dioxygenase beta subunit